MKTEKLPQCVFLLMIMESVMRCVRLYIFLLLTGVQCNSKSCRWILRNFQC